MRHIIIVSETEPELFNAAFKFYTKAYLLWDFCILGYAC